MDLSAKHRRGQITAWRWCAAALSYPVTILPGLNASVLLISSVCFGLNCWSLEGAMSNFSMGFPAVAGIIALWLTILAPLDWIACNRWRFMLVMTGLMMGLLVEFLFLKAGIQNHSIRLPRTGLLAFWVFGGPLLAGAVNLGLLVRARQRLFRALVPVPVRSVPAHHLGGTRGLRPVRLEPYRPPAPGPWWIPAEHLDRRVDQA